MKFQSVWKNYFKKIYSKSAIPILAILLAQISAGDNIVLQQIDYDLIGTVLNEAGFSLIKIRMFLTISLNMLFLIPTSSSCMQSPPECYDTKLLPNDLG